MKRKISFALLLALPFVSIADDYTVWRVFWYSTSLHTSSYVLHSATLSEAQELTMNYCNLYVIYNSNNQQIQVVNSAEASPQISNNTVNVAYPYTVNVPFNNLKSKCEKAIEFALTLDYSIDGLKKYIWPSWSSKSLNSFTTAYYPQYFNPTRALIIFQNALTEKQLLAYQQLVQNSSALVSDVSALVPLVESNRTINAGIASTVAGLGGVTNQLQFVLNNRLLNYTVDYDIPQIRDAVSGFRLLDPEQPTGDNTALMTYYYALRGLDFLDDQPGMVAQMVQDGFATSTADATDKLTSNTFRSSTLGPAVSVQRQKRDAIAKLKAAGMSSPPGGGSFDDMNLGELETLYQYSYNTPASSNAVVQAHALDELRQINQEATDAAGILSDIRNEVTGPQEVEVLNWPDDFSGLSVTLSNAFAEALANLNLNISSDVWQLGRDYEEYRNYAAGVDPSYNAFFEDASFLAVPGPNSGKWWTESQNLLAYIAYYTASNRALSAGILAELSTNNEWIAASLAAASNNLYAIWGDNPRGWLESKLDELKSGQTELLDSFDSLTYFDGVGDIIDSYYLDVQQLPDSINFSTPLPADFTIDLRRARGFFDLLHAATTTLIIGGWLICVPYIARWMFEHVNKMFDLFKR